MKLVQVPNIVLNNLWIENVTRSKAMKEQLEMSISFDTSLEDIEILRKEMEKFVQHPDNARDFQPDFILEAAGIGSMDKLVLKVEIRHKSNWHNETVRAARRSKFMCALVLALRKVPIYGPGGGGEPLGGPSNPGYSVSVSDQEAAEARAKAAAAKEAKRLVPTPAAIEAVENDKDAAEEMNQRNPLEDAAHGMDGAWSSSLDDHTLGSREASEEAHKRSTDIGELRDGLMKRKSTRGRRRAGDHVPATETQSQPNISLTAPEAYTPGFGRRDVVDEEAELGIYHTHSSGPLGGHGQDTVTGSPPSQNYSGQSQQGGYSVYSSQQGGYAQQQQQAYAQGSQLQPLASAPTRLESVELPVGPPPGGRKLSLDC